MQVMDKDNLIRNNMVAQVTGSMRGGTAQHSAAKGRCCVHTLAGADQPAQKSRHSAKEMCDVGAVQMLSSV